MGSQPKSGAVAAAALLGVPVLLFAHSSAAQEPTQEAWTQCELREDLPGGGQLIYRSSAKAGEATSHPEAIWSSPQTSAIQMKLLYVTRSPLLNAPILGQVTFAPGSQPGAGYKVVFDTSDGSRRGSPGHRNDLRTRL